MQPNVIFKEPKIIIPSAKSFDSQTSVSVHEHKLQRPKSKAEKASTPQALKSLIPQTLKEMDEDPEFIRVAQELELKGQKGMTKQERQRRQRALDKIGKSEKVYVEKYQIT
jgi:hypothetical protein